MSYFASFSPRVRVSVKDLITTEVLYDLSDDLTSISTNKAYGRCSGTWQLMLPHKQQYLSILPGQRLTIEIDAGNHAGFMPVMCGLIDRVSRVQQSGQVTQRVIKISGRDMGKLLETHDVAFDIITYTRAMAAQDGTTQTTPPGLTRVFNPQISMGTPASMIGGAFEICFQQMIDTAKRIQFVSDCADSWMMSQPNMTTSQGVSFWKYAKQVEHAPFNILTTDTTRGDVEAFLLILEQCPFDDTGHIERSRDRWHTFDDSSIIAEDIGLSDSERINLLSYQPAIYPQARTMSYDVMMAHADLTKLNDASARQYGLQAHVFNDHFTPPEMESLNDADPSNQLAAINTASGAAAALWNRYKNNHAYVSGTITVHLNPDMRVGDGLLVLHKNGQGYWEYFIEQVAHQCVFNPQPSFTTTLHLTRGQEASPKNAGNAR